VKVDVSGDVKVEISVLVIIPKGCPCAPHQLAAGNPGLSRDIGEGPVTIVFIENIRAVVVNKQIDESIVVIIRRYSPESPAVTLGAGLTSNIRKSPIAIV